ncbi:hypothetical protein BH09MYX1_BH09MYX1_61130 [soil metagenome]
MGINGNNNVNSTQSGSFNPDVGPGYLTPDALMSFCQSRLRGLDDQIQTAFAKQTRANAASQTLSALGEAMIPIKNNLDKENGKAALQGLETKYRNAAALTSDPELKKALLTQADKCEADRTSMGDDGLTAEQYKSYGSDFVASTQKDVNAGTELSMINLQSLMSQRQSSVQLVTNMVQALGDQMNKIAANIGH